MEYKDRKKIAELLQNLISLEGGGSVNSREHVVDLDSGPVSIRDKNLGVGGRAGINIPLADALLQLGVSGYWGKNKMEFPEELHALGAPESTNRINKRLTGFDAAYNKGDDRYSFRFDTPHEKEQKYLFRYNTKF